MLSVEERYKIWQVFLLRHEWVSYEEIGLAFAKKEGYNIEFGDEYKDFQSTIRKDWEKISKLLKKNGIAYSTRMVGRTTMICVESDDIDLLQFRTNDKVAQPYMAILDMLSRCKGLLPESFLCSLCEKYQKMVENVNVTKEISFEADYDLMMELDVFPDLYNALNKTAIRIIFHPANKLDDLSEGIFYPEYLKQYHSSWYAYGMFAREGEVPAFQRIPLNNIYDYNPVDSKSFPFLKSDIEDYDDYFNDIIGVENPEANEVETIRFRISNKMFHRLMNRPLHASQSLCEDLDTDGFHGMQIRVKYNMELMRVIMNLGSDIEVVEPAHIRKRVVREMRKTMKLYDE